ncbi:helix-turn-helix DNA binding domain protein [Mycobacterium phage Malec]|uniref:HTH DNA binding protein n=2 Tax=Turbidovirus TaxID=2948936 RepID=A0A0A0RU31_9CAUD|nr:HTH DNA binding protein [Mycobacterium phage Larenn]YP_010064156.1 helix-turn-helix DNA binding domain protein [Mycobacterium phage Malec]AIW02959.1 HTH DNA binding protein [Mycobacterium phage Larenn]AZV00859.1 helix-turn-helix DNA binding domain protein [Mycobacterium phage Malec]
MLTQESPMGTYFNTPKLAGERLKKARRASGQQAEKVKALFQRFGRLTPWQAWQRGVDQGEQWLITSVRMQITVLTDEGFLVKTDDQIEGPFGKPEHIWSLA